MYIAQIEFCEFVTEGVLIHNCFFSSKELRSLEKAIIEGNMVSFIIDKNFSLFSFERNALQEITKNL